MKGGEKMAFFEMQEKSFILDVIPGASLLQLWWSLDSSLVSGESSAMDIVVYRQCLKQLLQEAVRNSDGSREGMGDYLQSKTISGLFVRHREEKKRALAEARQAFEEHRHWPVGIIISHLGVEPEEIGLET
jgi:hypothetical protein